MNGIYNKSEKNMKEKKGLYVFLKIIYSNLLKVLYRPVAHGTENIPNEGAIIFAGNHTHAFDPIVVMTFTDRIVHYMAKESLFKGLHGILFKNVGLIKVYRTQKNLKAVLEAEEILKNGGTVGIFPEGTRNKGTEELLKFRYGAVRIAKQSNSKIIPFAIKGGYKLFRRGLIIEFGKTIDVSKMEIEEANKFVRNEVLKLLRR